MFRLALPKSMKVHLVFNEMLLLRAPDDEFNRCPVPLPPVLTPDGEEEYVVEQILDSKKVGRHLEYYVKWKGYGAEENTWEPKEHLSNTPDKVEEFHHKFPEAAGP